MSKATVYPIVPEVCQFCSDGLAWMTCHDDRFRCRKCVHRYANEQGWNVVPDRYKHEEKKSMPVLPPEEPKLEDKIYQQPEMF